MSFNTEDEGAKKSNQEEDDFGLPNLDYKPLDKLDQETPASEADEHHSPQMEEEVSVPETENKYVRGEESGFITEEEPPKTKAPLFIALIIGLVVLVAGFLVWRYVIEPSNLKKAKQEQEAKEKARKAKEEEARLAKIREEEERQRLAAEAENAKPKEGAIILLSEPTKRFYVVISSAVDGDLTMDYAKKLSAKGVGVKIIPPFGKWKFNRLAIGDYDSFDAAQSQANTVKSEYGEAVWVIRY